MHTQAVTSRSTTASEPTALSKSHIPIVPRRMKWDFADLKERFFFGGNSLKSAFVVALSGAFPPGEKEFIQSVRLYANQLRDEKLIEDVQAFTAQEGQHSLQHKLLNDAFDRLGYSATLVSRECEALEAQWARERSDADRLAMTVVMEHITAVMAHFALSHPEEFDALPASLREMLIWHAIEEIEHKSVAFDVYMECVGDRNRLRRRLLQELIMFPFAVGMFQRMLLRHLAHKPTLRERAEMVRYVLGPRGLILSVLPHYLALLKPGFHPWSIDDSHLVEQWKDDLQAA